MEWNQLVEENCNPGNSRGNEVSDSIIHSRHTLELTALRNRFHRPDYLSEELTPNLLKMARSGVVSRNEP